MITPDADDLTGLFRQEANAIVEALSETLLRFERDETSSEARTDTMRHLHTMKGMANMEGHADLAQLCHDAETILSAEEDPPIEELLRRVDQMRLWLQDHGLGPRKNDTEGGTAYVTVQTDRLDRLLNLAGELTVTSTRLAYEEQAGESSAHTLRALTGLVRNLQEEVMKTRLLPARTLFAGLPRLTRDAAKKRGVEVDLVLDEGDIGLDRSIVDRLGGVLAHLIQNSVSHGIEPPEERQAAGKPRRGVVRVTIRRDQEMVALELEDDGRGLAESKIRAHAVETGLWSGEGDASAATQEVNEVVFSPGFSTSPTADSLAGRGIGLTAVRETVRELGGNLQLFSTPGKGTRIAIQLPPTIALLETLVAHVEGSTIALPLRNVRRIHHIEEAAVVGSSRMLFDADKAIPLLSLDGSPAETGRGRFAVVLDAARGTYALAVDELLGTHSTILKPLDPSVLEAHANAMGAAVLGSGTLAIIVDPNHYHGQA